MRVKEVSVNDCIMVIKKIAIVLILITPIITLIFAGLIPSIIQIKSDLIRHESIALKIDRISNKINDKKIAIEEKYKHLSVVILTDKEAQLSLENDFKILASAFNKSCSITNIHPLVTDNSHYPIIKLQQEIRISGNWPECSETLIDVSEKISSHIKDFSVFSHENDNVEIVFYLYSEGIAHDKITSN